MEEIPMYSAYDICQHQGCQCRSCDHDQGGVCGIDEGDCESAQKSERCPVGGCTAWIPKAAENLQITEYTIADMIRDLREAFRVQYGVKASISIDIYSADNPELTREDAERLGKEMAKVFPGTSEMGHREGETAKWFRVDPPREERTEIILFYSLQGGPA